jgi:hypothetical protein
VARKGWKTWLPISHIEICILLHLRVLCRNLSAISIKFVGDDYCVKAGQQSQAGWRER